MIKKTENCIYCGEKMESKTAKKKFCSTKCRVYYKRELARGTLNLPKVGHVMLNAMPVIDNKPSIVFDRKQHNHSLTLTVRPQIDEKAINDRIAVLRKEVDKPPSGISIPIRVYKNVRLQQIKELEAQLKP